VLMPGEAEAGGVAGGVFNRGVLSAGRDAYECGSAACCKLPRACSAGAATPSVCVVAGIASKHASQVCSCQVQVCVDRWNACVCARLQAKCVLLHEQCPISAVWCSHGLQPALTLQIVTDWVGNCDISNFFNFLTPRQWFAMSVLAVQPVRELVDSAASTFNGLVDSAASEKVAPAGAAAMSCSLHHPMVCGTLAETTQCMVHPCILSHFADVGQLMARWPGGKSGT